MLGKVRPTTGKVLESLLATLEPCWEGARVLDLFAGSGTLGRAAKECGAREVVCVEGHARVAATLRGQGKVIVGVLPAALQKLQGPFDVVLGDPPYGCAEGPLTLLALEPLLAEGAWVAWEHHHKDPYPDRFGGCELWRRRRFGETALSYYRQGGMGSS